MGIYRDLSALTKDEFDLIVIGGGILGACVAWDGATRGLTVGLIEAGDFASGTSSNSLKIVHGGLRYLQHIDIKRMRESIKERTFWLRAAPHLVEPLPVLVPTYRGGIQRKNLLRLALALNDAISWDRNRGVCEDRQLPAGHSLSRAECIALVPELEEPGLTGGVMFYDALMYSSERLVLEVLDAAAAAGATVVNYVRFEDALPSPGGGACLRTRDVISDATFELQTRTVVNAAGPRAEDVAKRLTGDATAYPAIHSLAMNVVVPSRGHRVAFSVTGRERDPDAVVQLGRQYFFVPWRERLLVGTAHYTFAGDPAEFQVDESDVARFLADLNSCWPGPELRRDDVLLVHSGLIPGEQGGRDRSVSFLKRPRIIDHTVHGAAYAITATTGKYTTARRSAQAVVDLVLHRFGRTAQLCRTVRASLPGAPPSTVQGLLTEAHERLGDRLDTDVLEHLVRTYGRRYLAALGPLHTLDERRDRVEPSSPVIKAEWVHAIRHEAAIKAEDLVWRRTELGARGPVTQELIRCADSLLEAQRRIDQGHRAPRD